jgi:hypothetical protein
VKKVYGRTLMKKEESIHVLNTIIAKMVLRRSNGLTYFCDKYRHLVCVPFSIENLHVMAEDLKIGKHFFEYSAHGRLPHYDIPAQRKKEIMQQCNVVIREEIVNIIKNNTQTI